MPTQWVDLPPPGWFVLDVMKITDARKLDWCALMIDVDPDEMQHCPCKSAFFCIPGKHRNRDAAWDALEDMLATRH
jgi:hypothetical protein